MRLALARLQYRAFIRLYDAADAVRRWADRKVERLELAHGPDEFEDLLWG
jgi:hypothetical protein